MRSRNVSSLFPEHELITYQKLRLSNTVLVYTLSLIIIMMRHAAKKRIVISCEPTLLPVRRTQQQASANTPSRHHVRMTTLPPQRVSPGRSGILTLADARFTILLLTSLSVLVTRAWSKEADKYQRWLVEGGSKALN